eukprot:2430945-Pleurochrysis_carterae.AAC.1
MPVSSLVAKSAVAQDGGGIFARLQISVLMNKSSISSCTAAGGEAAVTPPTDPRVQTFFMRRTQTKSQCSHPRRAPPHA